MPIHSSLSGTLDQAHLRTVTSIIADESFDRDRFWLNGEEDDVNAKRIQQCLKEIRARIKDIKLPNGTLAPAQKLKSLKIHICSENNFPTASGLASSAAGFACLAFALSKLFRIQEQYEGEVSTIARMGSGSACRSIYGGFVKWEVGERADGKDSVAVQVAPEGHWPLKVLILVASQKKKETSSTSGMETTVNTSDLIQYRKTNVVPERMKKMEKAIKERDFETFAVETIKDSNQFHAVCLDTYPPIFYLNEISKKVIALITKYNSLHKNLRVAYTFDAGPNAVLYIQPEHYEEVLNLVNYHFPLSHNKKQVTLSNELKNLIEPCPDLLANIIATNIGPGPQVLSSSESLFDSNLLPKKLKTKSKL
uniref:Diphosphomevalonate decarboxylase n=1 Tax=Arcella intermedia TaxID=1963864 RepID=A0A6B2L6M2_9EUKA